MAIVYAVVAQQSLGELLVGSIFPGLLLSGRFLRSHPLLHQPEARPRGAARRARRLARKIAAVEKHHRADPADRPGARRDLVGIATPVEAADIGTFGALFVSALHRRLTWPAVQEAAIATLKATAMVMWIFFGATMVVGFFIVKGGQTFVADSILGTGLPPTASSR